RRFLQEQPVGVAEFVEAPRGTQAGGSAADDDDGARHDFKARRKESSWIVAWLQNLANRHPPSDDTPAARERNSTSCSTTSNRPRLRKMASINDGMSESVGIAARACCHTARRTILKGAFASRIDTPNSRGRTRGIVELMIRRADEPPRVERTPSRASCRVAT